MASIWKHPNSRFLTACYTDKDGEQAKRSTKQTDRRKALAIALEFERVPVAASHSSGVAYNLWPIILLAAVANFPGLVLALQLKLLRWAGPDPGPRDSSLGGGVFIGQAQVLVVCSTRMPLPSSSGNQRD